MTFGIQERSGHWKLDEEHCITGCAAFTGKRLQTWHTADYGMLMMKKL